MSKRHVEYHIASVALASSFVVTSGAVGAVGCYVFMPEYTFECAVGAAFMVGASVFYIESFG